MRVLFAAAMAMVAVGFANAGTASAAYECQGPAAACAKAHKHANKKASYKKASKKAYGYKSAKKKSYSVSSGSSYSGMGSYYWQPQRVASGGWFNPNAMTAAHKTLPFGTKVRVTNRNNGRSVVVTINDRGPYIKGRIIDLSKAAAKQVGMTASGVAPVSVTVLGRG
ncbi:MAG: septal ring lytic transglycosylase RlpA family lipoprotein [Hyphomicrobium sp.]|nr:septal ring lytic transglycosylase RlpA family lipoprotein [Hyphomicrobium sp.]PPD06942.1 MAG: septal ring lytic transglycosylase RlpA family lipoprotein [Hyphomicrobium sp.]